MTSFFSLLKTTFAEWAEDRVPRMGAALAYYTMFSMAPLLLIAIAIAGTVFGEEAARGEIVTQLQSTIGQSAAQAVEGMIENTSTPEGNTLMTVVGIVVLLIGASGVFSELQDSLNQIWQAPPVKGSGLWNTIRRRFLSFAMILGIGFLLLVSLVISAALSGVAKYLTPSALPGGAFLWQAIHFAVSFAFITALFALIYRLLPDVKPRWRDVWVGSILTAFLFTIGKYLIGIYLGQGSISSSFGAAGSLVVLMVWVYYSSQILLFGAEFTRLYAESRGDVEPRGERSDSDAANSPNPRRAAG